MLLPVGLVTTTLPVAPPTIVAVICASLSTTKEEPVPPNVTEVVPVKPLPLITTVPPLYCDAGV